MTVSLINLRVSKVVQVKGQALVYVVHAHIYKRAHMCYRIWWADQPHNIG